jgi:hypothetical protein
MFDGSLDLSAGCVILAGELVTLAPLALSAECVTLAGESVTLALLDLSAECETLAGESVSLASSSAALSGPPSGSATRGPIGSLPLSADCVTLAGVATRASSGIPLGFFEVDLLLLGRFGSGVLLDLPGVKTFEFY